MANTRRKRRYDELLIFLLLFFSVFPEQIGAKITLHQRNRGGHHNPKYGFVPASNIGIVTLREVKLPPAHFKQLDLNPQKKIFKLNNPQNASPLKYDYHPMKKCKGRKNLLDDIGILSLITAVTASSIGLYTVIVNSMTSNNIGIVSGLFSIIIWLPSTLLTMWNVSGGLATQIGNLLNNMSFLNSMYGFMGVLFGTMDVLSSTVGESIGILSLILSVVATFPEWLDSIIEYLYKVGDRRKLEYYVENYGCGVPGIFNLDGSGIPLYERINKFLVQETDKKGIYPKGLF